MTSAWADAWTTASADIDDRFGSYFLYLPMAPNPNGGRPIADPSRLPPSNPIVAALDEMPVFTYPNARHKSENTVQRQSTHEATIDMAADALPYDAASGDLLQQCDEDGVPNGATFRVDAPKSDEIARVILLVIKVKSSV